MVHVVQSRQSKRKEERARIKREKERAEVIVSPGGVPPEISQEELGKPLGFFKPFEKPLEVAGTGKPSPALLAEQERERLEAPGVAKELQVKTAAEELLEAREEEKLEVITTPIPPIVNETLEQSQIMTKEERGVLAKIFKTKDGKFKTDLGGQFEQATGNKIVSGTVPIGGIPVGAPAIAANVAKTKIAFSLAAKAKTYIPKAIAFGAAFIGLKTILAVPEKRMSDVLAELRIMKTDGRTILKTIPLGPEFALDGLDYMDEMELALDEYERVIDREQARSFQGRVLGYGKFAETQLFIDSLRRYLVPLRQLSARAAVGGTVTPEEVALLLSEDVTQ